MIEPLEDIKPALPLGPFWCLNDKPGFGKYDHVHLITPRDFKHVAQGVRLFSIMGERAVVGTDEIDTDTRGGYMAWGHICMNKDCLPKEER